MKDMDAKFLSASGHEIGSTEIAHAQDVVQMCSGLSRRELALTLCEHWDWYGATGKPQIRAASKVLEKLEKQDLLKLPKKQSSQRRQHTDHKELVFSPITDPQAQIECKLSSLQPISLECALKSDSKKLWNEYVERYHNLGYKPPFGCSLRYFIVSEKGRLGCLLLASGARALHCRDEWIGWSAQQRLRNLPWVINNSRFVLFPWVKVSYLASHVLGKLVRQVRKDWSTHWGYRPVLMESFVDPKMHQGVCYRAANWQMIGQTIGQGIKLNNHNYRTTPKLIFVNPLVRDFRARLCSLNNPERQKNEM